MFFSWPRAQINLLFALVLEHCVSSLLCMCDLVRIGASLWSILSAFMKGIFVMSSFAEFAKEIWMIIYPWSKDHTLGSMIGWETRLKRQKMRKDDKRLVVVARLGPLLLSANVTWFCQIFHHYQTMFGIPPNSGTCWALTWTTSSSSSHTNASSPARQ